MQTLATEYQEKEPEVIEVAPTYSENQKRTALVDPKAGIVEVERRSCAHRGDLTPSPGRPREDKQAERNQSKLSLRTKEAPKPNPAALAKKDRRSHTKRQ